MIELIKKFMLLLKGSKKIKGPHNKILNQSIDDTKIDENNGVQTSTNTEPEIDPCEAIRSMFNDIRTEILSKASLFMRVNFIINSLLDSSDECLIDWEKINNILYKNYSLDEYEYNVDLKDIYSQDELFKLRNNILTAQCNLAPWQVHTCVDCGETFIISFNEMTFYRDKNLHLPKRCKKCRDLRRGKK